MEAMLKDIAQVFGDLPLPNRQLEIHMALILLINLSRVLMFFVLISP
jgi:hypothetical protein